VDVATITIGIDPTLELGPLTLAWHGIMTAAGIAAGAWLGQRYARERGLDRELVLGAVVVMAVAGVVGARLLFLVEAEPDALGRPGDWLGSHGFSFYGALVVGAAAGALYLRWRGGGLRELDALAAGFPLGIAAGRLGDVINGEHFGPPTTAPWGLRHTHPEALVPSPEVAYHSGGLYELLLGAVLVAVIWPLRHRFQRPGTLLWTVMGAYAAGRFAMFFYRRDSEEAALGLVQAQWTSLALVAASAVAIAMLARPRARHSSHTSARGAADASIADPSAAGDGSEGDHLVPVVDEPP